MKNFSGESANRVVYAERRMKSDHMIISIYVYMKEFYTICERYALMSNYNERDHFRKYSSHFDIGLIWCSASIFIHPRDLLIIIFRVPQIDRMMYIITSEIIHITD